MLRLNFTQDRVPPNPEMREGRGSEGPTRTPVVLQHTATKIFRELRKQEPDLKKRRSRAFAIATAALQNAGVFTPGTRRLTRYGRRIEREHTREDPEVLARKLRAYERMLRAGEFDQNLSVRQNPNGGFSDIDEDFDMDMMILSQIRDTARRAADYRLHGAIRQAQHVEVELDRLMVMAEQGGYGDEAVEAEEEGREAARERQNPASCERRSPVRGNQRRGHRGNPREGERWIDLSPETASVASSWYSGQWDPLYAVMSRHYARQWVWDVSGTRTLIRASEDEIEALQRMARDILDSEEMDLSDMELQVAHEILYEDALFDIGEGPE